MAAEKSAKKTKFTGVYLVQGHRNCEAMRKALRESAAKAAEDAERARISKENAQRRDAEERSRAFEEGKALWDSDPFVKARSADGGLPALLAASKALKNIQMLRGLVAYLDIAALFAKSASRAEADEAAGKAISAWWERQRGPSAGSTPCAGSPQARSFFDTRLCACLVLGLY